MLGKKTRTAGPSIFTFSGTGLIVHETFRSENFQNGGSWGEVFFFMAYR